MTFLPPLEIVTDANLWLNVVLSTHPYHAAARQLAADCLSSGVGLIAPSWWEAEADSALRRMVAGKALTPTAAHNTQLALDAAPVQAVYEPSARAIARQVADTIGQSRVYDATYVALAVARRCPLWTADERLFNALQNEGRGAYPVRFVGSYAGQYARPVSAHE